MIELNLKAAGTIRNLKGFLEATIDFALENEESGPWLRQFIKKRRRNWNKGPHFIEYGRGGPDFSAVSISICIARLREVPRTG